mgnify:FL=1
MKNLLPLTLCVSLLVAAPVIAQDSLSLQACIDLALKNNYAVKNSQLELTAALQTRRAAVTNYFPQIGAGGLQFHAEQPLMAFGSGSESMGLLEKGSVAYVGAVQPLFAGGRILNGNKLASLGVEVARSKGARTRDEVVLQTEVQFWQVISLQEKTRTIRAYEQMLDSLQSQVEDAYASGVVMQNDLLKVRLQRSEVMLNKSQLSNRLTLASMAFCQYLGLPLNSDLVLRDSLAIDGPPQPLRVDHSRALTARSEYKLIELSVEAEKLQTNLVRGEYLPQVAVGANYQRLKFDDGDSRSFGMVDGTISVPISDWWRGSHELSKRKQQQRIAENNFRDNAEQLLLQMEKSWQDLTDAYTQVLLGEEAQRQAAENMKVNQDSYDNGLTPVSDLLEARALLQQAQDQAVEARAHYLTQRSHYLQATGRLQH